MSPKLAWSQELPGGLIKHTKSQVILNPQTYSTRIFGDGPWEVVRKTHHKKRIYWLSLLDGISLEKYQTLLPLNVCISQETFGCIMKTDIISECTALGTKINPSSWDTHNNYTSWHSGLQIHLFLLRLSRVSSPIPGEAAKFILFSCRAEKQSFDSGNCIMGRKAHKWGLSISLRNPLLIQQLPCFFFILPNVLNEVFLKPAFPFSHWPNLPTLHMGQFHWVTYPFNQYWAFRVLRLAPRQHWTKPGHCPQILHSSGRKNTHK